MPKLCTGDYVKNLLLHSLACKTKCLHKATNGTIAAMSQQGRGGWGWGGGVWEGRQEGVNVRSPESALSCIAGSPTQVSKGPLLHHHEQHSNNKKQKAAQTAKKH